MMYKPYKKTENIYKRLNRGCEPFEMTQMYTECDNVTDNGKPKK